MSTQATDLSNQTKTVGEVIAKCWRRQKTWVDWLCDHEGPPFGKYLLDVVLKFFGLIIGVLGALGLLDSFTLSYVSVLPEIETRYVSAGFLLLGITLYHLGRHTRRIELKTGVYPEDIDALICDVEQSKSTLNGGKKEEAEYQVKRIIYFKGKPSEVSIKRLTSLKKLKIDTLDVVSLVAHSRASLLEYKFLVHDHENYIRYETAINGLISRNELVALKSCLKELHDEIADEAFSIRYGEAILESLSRWGVVAIIPFFIIGVNPLFSIPNFENQLTFLNWGFLGMSGAVLFTLNRMRNRESTRVGEDEGNTELRIMLLGITLGATAAILLYVSIKSRIFGGKALPRLNDEIGIDQSNAVINALTVFWGIAAGFSAKLAERLVGSSSGATTS